MHLSELKGLLPEKGYAVLAQSITELRPAQEKAIASGLLEGKNLVVCTPTASGKTLIAELAIQKTVLEGRGKALYIVPLKALAREKYKDFRERYKGVFSVGISVGDLDASDTYLSRYEVIITTSEKLDSLIRHKTPWIGQVRLVIADEIHLLNDHGRGPTLEIVLTILREIAHDMQILGLSATIGNPEELAEWLDAGLVQDSWRPVELKRGVLFGREIEFVE
ncbi:TPA: DEAD/DEAH box helicase [Candidatus Woesearchaeota archaeon]|nr:DEAD/DEAH box helicase [Candidatus Woesearchaeota archaeon]HII68891.1 DEAD/DEAH box helicase [Candidatus Woesearchaeota archaeon]